MSQTGKLKSTSATFRSSITLRSACACLSLHHTVNDLTVSRQREPAACVMNQSAEKRSCALTGVFLDELVDVDPAACAPCVEHDPVENPAHVDGGGGFRLRLVNLWRVVGLRCRVHHLGHRVESLRDGMDDLGRRVEDLGDVGVGRFAGLRDSRRRVGDVREEVFCVGRVLSVAVEVGYIPVVPVVSRLC